jgi:hypothetical protein
MQGEPCGLTEVYFHFGRKCCFQPLDHNAADRNIFISDHYYCINKRYTDFIFDVVGNG